MSDKEEEHKSATEIRMRVELLRAWFGDDRDLVRQIIADLNAEARDVHGRHFEARKEYTKQVAELRQNAREGIVNYGLQTLRWLFLLNAGAITVILAYIGSAVAKANTVNLSKFSGLLTSLWPFAIGCVLVVLAGAAGYFNFCYADGLYPGPEALHNFLNPSSRKWPLAQFQRDGETPQQFRKRFAWKADATRWVAIISTITSGAAFGFGVFLILSAADVALQ
jgi:hypothetical protein